VFCCGDFADLRSRCAIQPCFPIHVALHQLFEQDETSTVTPAGNAASHTDVTLGDAYNGVRSVVR
jgi:hypothetical protein